MTPTDLREWKRQRGLTIAEMAATLKCSRSLVDKMLGGSRKVPPRIELIIELLDRQPEPERA